MFIKSSDRSLGSRRKSPDLHVTDDNKFIYLLVYKRLRLYMNINSTSFRGYIFFSFFFSKGPKHLWVSAVLIKPRGPKSAFVSGWHESIRDA